ncbi:MAG: acetoin:2,6-dichlorophenolindophenol oxidoreductase subunit alpha [Gaiellales bacterium]|jgi:pyruvate dehydrogenase E1 component alpha subunit|nr:acetoin:2,6-dichlorophenolindophenol oxidoreductase subunit alpha [Gaiellales bacterium]
MTETTVALAERSADGYDRELLLSMYRSMVKIREVEQALVRLFAQGRMPGFIHSYIGEEATAVGVCSALRRDDYITSTHRGHGHILAKGGDLDRFMAEIYGRSTGYSGGKGGSMHIADLDLGILGANGIVGGGIPIAAGAACSARMAGSDRVAVSFFGDGASDIGVFHESLNLAAVWDLPVVFVCENNGYADFIATHEHQRVKNISDRAAAYGMPGEWFDGNDVLAAHEATIRAVERARAGAGPTLLEAKTYRWRGHYEGDPQPYRTSDEVEKWRERDPIPAFAGFLERNQIQTAEEAGTVRDEELERLERAIKFAEASPEPEPRDALRDTYTDIVERGW